MAELRSWLRATHAEAHLLVCPFAGSSSGAFHSWRGLEHLGLDLSLAVYPGRDQRMHEPCERQIGPLAQRLARAIQAMPEVPEVPLILAGHSMGAQVAFETCLLLEQAGSPPDGLVLSACHAPHLSGRRLLSHLDDSRFVEQLVAIGGCSDTLRDEPSLLQVFMPVLRADFQATESYHRPLQAGHPQVHTPTLLLHGSHDPEASEDEVAAWRAWLAGDSEHQAVSGDHFYLTQRPRAFAAHLQAFIERRISLFHH